MRSETGRADFGEVAALLDELVDSQQLPGANVVIHRSGQEIFYHQSGFSDIANGTPIARDSMFRLFSMTKPVIAAATMVLIDDGALSLDDAVVDHIPEFAGLGVYADKASDATRPSPAHILTVKHLLTHTAGFSYWFQSGNPVGALYAADPGINQDRWRYDPLFGGLDGLARVLGELPLVAQPGTRWHYSMSFEVAGILIERVSGQRLDDFLRRRVFDPLKMDDTVFWVEPGKSHRLASLYRPKEGGGMELAESGADSPRLKPVPGLAGGGGLISTVDDYGRFAEMLLRKGEFGGARILSAQSARAILSNHLLPDQLEELPELAKWGLGGAGDGMGFGLGGAVVLRPPANGVPAFPGEYSWGGGCSTTFWIDPKHDLSVVFMTQRFPPAADMPRDLLHSAVYNALGLA
ncbi:serine hydrolase domain-containing protein [Sphingobium chungbukense]|uniref:Beta-lactamase-related domain-containing protein n=1 Tax=Sphingobium chungbukense TaxID=56193 RepID=A0A0M3ANU3_9SPHN|nr:serine hydrolase domain-containing protein [Sphingobium chungbukense]KKW91613.1 hypothetical protein YP76_14670 [Sphingobium chungbukense]